VSHPLPLVPPVYQVIPSPKRHGIYAVRDDGERRVRSYVGWRSTSALAKRWVKYLEERDAELYHRG
jgi:hypothetical protein